MADKAAYNPSRRKSRRRALDVLYQAEINTLWTFMRPEGRPSFTPSMLADFEQAAELVSQHHRYSGNQERAAEPSGDRFQPSAPPLTVLPDISPRKRGENV